jgi:PAS domain S-box-containing protein
MKNNLFKKVFLNKKNHALKLILSAALVFFITNLSALVDLFLHPDIPYFDAEHIILGIISFLLCLLFLSYINQNNKFLSKKNQLQKQLIKQLSIAKEEIEKKAKSLNEAEKIAQLGTWEYDIENNKLICSDEIFRIFDCNTNEVILNYETFFEFVYPEDREMVNMVFQNCLKNKTSYEIEHRIITKNKSTKHVLEKCNIDFDENGNPQKSFGIIIDITKQKENEIQLKNLITTKDKIFSIIAHDLRSPFNGILGFSELLSENMRDFEIEESEKYVEIINTSAKNTLILLDNLLNWAKFQTGQIAFNPKKILISKVVKEIIEASNSIAKIKNITINYNQVEDIKVFTDENMLTVVLRNLLSNAIKFTRHGGNITISTILNENENEIEITISDNGIGMKAETLNNLFDSTIKNTSLGTANEKGSGLGLILCKEFIEMQGGKIWAESEEGKGSHFKFTTPVI